MQIDAQGVWIDIQAIKNKSPLIHNITNYVAMEHTANSLLAIGASPVMAHALEEVEAMVTHANSLVLNIGTLSPIWIQAMLLALKTANTRNIPIVFDPVGVGATPFRGETAQAILHQNSVSVIRGNASEIVSLNEQQVVSKGVDSLISTSDHSDQATDLAFKRKCIVWMSGETDIITDGKSTFLVYNGHPLMPKVTGMGCAATAITGAFVAVNKNLFLACAHAAILMGIAGEMAAENCAGPGSFKVAFIDALYNLSFNDIEERIRVKLQ